MYIRYGTPGMYCCVMEHSVTVLLLTRRGNFRFTFTGMIFIPVRASSAVSKVILIVR